MTENRITARELDQEFDRWWSEKKQGQWSGAEACKGFPVDLAHHIFREAWIRAQAWEEQQKKPLSGTAEA